MSKIISLIFCLCVTVPVVSMELELHQIKKEKKVESREKKEKGTLLITAEENQKFASELGNKLYFCKAVTANSMYIPQDNPIHKIIEILSKSFNECNKDVSRLIKHYSLEQRINNYKKICDSNKVIKSCLQQIHEKEGDVNLARNIIATNRQVLAERRLKDLQPHYCSQYLGATQIQDKIDHMKKNKDYPLNDDAIKDFMVLLIYEIIFAHQTH